VTSAGGGDWTLGGEARSRALLSEDDVADASTWRRSDPSAAPASVASWPARRVYGEWLRRENRQHTAAMRLLHAGIDIAVIALWLGHEQIATTHIYLHADVNQKERAITRVTPPNTTPGRYRPPDPLLAFLDSLWLFRPNHGRVPLPCRPSDDQVGTISTSDQSAFGTGGTTSRSGWAHAARPVKRPRRTRASSARAPCAPTTGPARETAR
jgi:hypothetical protein